MKTRSIVAIQCLFMLVMPMASACAMEPQDFEEVKALDKSRDKSEASVKIFQEKYAQSAKLLIAILQDEKKGRYARVNAAKLLGTMRATEAVQVLVDNILLSPDIFDEKTRESVSPCAHALELIGLPSVQPLLAEIKKTDASDGEKSAFKRMLLITCINNIYKQGGFGTDLARKRIELELAASKDGKEKANLQAALAHPDLKE